MNRIRGRLRKKRQRTESVTKDSDEEFPHINDFFGPPSREEVKLANEVIRTDMKKLVDNLEKPLRAAANRNTSGEPQEYKKLLFKFMMLTASTYRQVENVYKAEFVKKSEEERYQEALKQHNSGDKERISRLRQEAKERDNSVRYVP